MNAAMPKVKVYPLCSECRAPYVLRHGFNLSDGGREVWIWQRDCKHKKALPLSSESPRVRATGAARSAPGPSNSSPIAADKGEGRG